MARIRPLRSTDDRSRFASGNAALDRFFREYAGQNQFGHHIGATYVAEEGGDIAGFLTVSASHLAIDRLPTSLKRRLPNYPLPVLRLARLAVDQKSQGRGIGLELLFAALRIARDMAALAGCVGVVVDAKPDAVAFYERFGFGRIDLLDGHLPTRPEPIAMFLPLSMIPA